MERRAAAASSSHAGSGSASAAAAAGRRPPGARRAALSMAELRAKAAFRACDRLMERGASDGAQLWGVARVMAGAEYEQAAEERALAGKCGNPLCGRPPRQSVDASNSVGARYHISTSQQAVFDRSAAEDSQSIFCGPECAAEVNRFAVRLGSGSLALDRFSAMYEQLQQQQRQEQQLVQQQPGQESSSAQSLAVLAPAAAAGPAAEAPTTPPAALAAARSAAAFTGPAPEAAASGVASGKPGISTDSVPGGITSATTLVPRLAVEQVPVKLIDSSAGQFADFSRKVVAKPAGSTPLGSGGQQRDGSRPKGVLKKHSQFAAGTAKVPIMLAEVKERDPSIVAADTARSLPPASVRSLMAATAVEGYVPRAMSSHMQQAKHGLRQPQRRVRWSDEVDAEEPGDEERQRDQPQQAPEQQAAELRQQAAELLPQQASPSQQPQQTSAGGEPQQASAGQVLSVSGQADAINGRAALADMPPAAGSPAAASAGSVFVFDVEEPTGPLETSKVGLAAQFGRLRVADPADLPGTIAPSSSASAGTRAQPSRSACVPSSRTGDIENQGRDRGVGSPSTWTVPPEWRAAPQFYAHSPVGSSSSLAGSVSSPAGSSNSLALAAAAGSPPAVSKMRQAAARPSPGPPGLPRSPQSISVVASNSTSNGLATQPCNQAPAGLPEGDAPEEEEQQQQPMLTKRQAEQLQLAFPPLSAALPPELQAALASDSETESEVDSENWMRSDDEEAERADSSGDEHSLFDGSRSNYRIQLSFFGTMFTHLEAWVTPDTVDLLATGPDAELLLQPPTSPEVLATLDRLLAAALPPVMLALQSSAPRGEVERSLEELLRTLRLVGPLPSFKVGQWQVVVVLLLKALSLERCPPLRPAFETREGIGRVNQLLARLRFTSEEFYAALELLCPVP